MKSDQRDAQRLKRRTIIAVAAARELAGFCWALATHDAARQLTALPQGLAV